MRRLCHSLFLVFCAVFGFALMALPLRADTVIDVAALAMGDSGEGWTFDGTNLVLSAEGRYVAYGTRTAMSIRADADCTLVASNLSVSAVGLAKPGLDCNYCDVTLLLWSDNSFNNTFLGGTQCAGIAAHADSTGKTGTTLVISNLNETATMVAKGGEGGGGTAGIGGNNQKKGGFIIIRGGIITATAGVPGGNSGGAGIGGGYKCGVISVIISGGKITASGAKEGAGIGAGRDGSSSYIEISGGTVTAKGSSGGSGLGTGYKGSSSGTIVISGGTVTASSGGSAGIGGAASNIQISGGTVSASGNGYAIGGSSGSVEISGGRITATSNLANTSVAIGGSLKSILISGGTVKATGKYQGIGKPVSGNVGAVTITGGSIIQSPMLNPPLPIQTDGTNELFELTIPGLTPNVLANVTGLPNNYGLKDVYADANGQIYVYLPKGKGSFSVEGIDYCYTIIDTATKAYLASEIFDITFMNANPERGMISTEGGSYPGGTIVTVVATPLSKDTVFDKWTGIMPDGVDARSSEISFMTGNGDVALTAHFVDPIYVNGRSVGHGSGDGWTYLNNMLTLSSAGPFVIHGTSTYSRIFVDADCTIIASNLYVSAVELPSPALDCNFHDVALKLWSDVPYRNEFYGGPNKAGIAVVSTNIALVECGAKLTISELNPDAALYVEGGSYTSTSTSGSAGIGGGIGQHAGAIDIQGGKITVNAGAQPGNAGGTAIGGPYSRSYHSISISGGTVSATGTKEGAAIGTGRVGAKGGVIAISGGRITASTKGYGYGIGGGYESAGGIIQITGGTISGSIGARSAGAVVTINGGTFLSSSFNPAPTDGSQKVYRVTTTVLDGTTPIKNKKVSVRVLRNYGVKDIYTDANGRLYFYLPNGSRRFRVDDKRYQYTVNSAATTATQFFEWPTILLLK